MGSAPDIMTTTMAAKWIAMVEDRLDSPEQTQMKEDGKKSREWYQNKGQYDDKNDWVWKGDLVRGNLWYRDVNTMAAAVLAHDPRISVLSTLRDPIFQRASAAIEALATRIAGETRLFKELEAAYLTAKHDNLAFVRMHWDAFRQIPTYRWCEGQVVMDDLGHGMTNRARWIAEVIERPLSEVLQDIALPLEKRQKLRKKLMSNSLHEKIDYERLVKLYYIWSKTGSTPWIKSTGRKLIIICDAMQDDPMLVDEWPWPFLDADEFPIDVLRLDWIPGQFQGVTPFRVAEPLLKQYNWLSSFLQSSIRREVTKKVLYDDTVDDPSKLTSGKYLELIKVEANDGLDNHVKVLDFTGSGAGDALQALELVKAQHDEQTGVTDIVRGQALGGRTTAEETRTLSRNASMVFQREGKIVDDFVNEVVRKFCMALLYYIPQWSRVVSDTDPLTGVPIVDITGIRHNTLITKTWDALAGWITVKVDDEEASALTDPDIHPSGYVARAGTDAWIGDDHAEAWLVYDEEQLRRDFSFRIEAGSSRAEHSVTEQRNTMTMLQVLGPVYQQFGLFEQYYELIRMFILAFRLPDPHRLIPPMEQFVMQASFSPQPTAPGRADGDKATPDEQPPMQSFNAGFSAEGTPSPEGISDAEQRVF
jgi:hypothetical protein